LFLIHPADGLVRAAAEQAAPVELPLARIWNVIFSKPQPPAQSRAAGDYALLR